MHMVRWSLAVAAAVFAIAAVSALAIAQSPAQSQSPAPNEPQETSPAQGHSPSSEAARPVPAPTEDDLDMPAAGAAPGGRRGAALQACRGDIQALCQGVERGRGQIVQCLVKNRDKASADCQSALAAAAANGRQGGRIAGGKGAAFAACRTDVATFCGQPGERPGPCLKQNFAKLSPECQSTLMALRAKRQQVASSCRAEGSELCPGQQGRPALECLRQNEAKLGPACAGALKELPQRLGRARSEPSPQ